MQAIWNCVGLPRAAGGAPVAAGWAAHRDARVAKPIPDRPACKNRRRSAIDSVIVSPSWANVFVVVAPQGRQVIARGASPWARWPSIVEAPFAPPGLRTI